MRTLDYFLDQLYTPSFGRIYSMEYYRAREGLGKKFFNKLLRLSLNYVTILLLLLFF